MKPTISFLSTLVIAAVTTFASSASARTALDVVPLSEARAKLKPEAYSAEQRELMARQALFFIKNLFVHRELKIKDFGAGSDPVPRLEDMVKRAASLSDSEFHAAMQKIFLDLHDHHTNYMAPLPLRCSYAIAPLDFVDVYDNNTLKVVVRGRTTVLGEKAPETKVAQPGDELIALNGKPIKDVLEDMKRLSGGANDDAMTMGAIMHLAFVPLAEQPVPENDLIKYTLKRGNETIQIDSRYFAAVNIPSCVEEVKGRFSRRTFGRADFLRAENPHIRVYKDLVAPPSLAPFSEEGKLPVGQFYTISTPAGKLAKFDLETFVPEGQESSDSVIHMVKKLLEKSQDEADALIIDMRGNGGGLILLAEGLTQLFTPNAVAPMPVRYLPNDLNLTMFLNSNQGHENGWSKDTRDAIAAGARYTKPRVITSADAANRYGQVWFKPVVILTDASCYSACDLFAASMQDHAGATIIGTHASTGAGGANVMEYDIFRIIFDAANPASNPFLTLPGHQGMRVSWRQTIRAGKNAGALIEDAGVKSDVVVRYQTADIVGGESRLLMKRVHEEISKILPRYKSGIKLQSSLKMANGSAAKWTESVKGIDTLQVVDKSGKVLREFSVGAGEQSQEIELPGLKGSWSDAPLHLVGKSQNQVQFRVIRELRWRGESIKAGTKASETFTGDQLSYFHVEQSSGAAGESWQVRGNALVVGKSDHYSPNVITQTFATFDTAGARALAIDLAMTMETEEDMDFVNIIVRDPNTGDEEYVASLSGTLTVAPQGKVQIPVNGAKELELVFEFTSDENWHLKGPKITKLGAQTVSSRGFWFSGWFHSLLGQM
jgi:C-terminal processing protease CtpA/Prc